MLTAKTGKELLKVWKAAHCEVVLSDIRMPGALDGIEACEAVRLADSRVRVFLMTGDPENRERAREKGFRMAFFKPFTLQDIRRWLRSLDAPDRGLPR